MGDLEQDVAVLRAFNRTYTARLGLLSARYDRSPFTLSEARILYELANRAQPTAAELSRDLGLDAAQLSRTLRRFGARGLVETHPDLAHRRIQRLALTETGRSVFAALEASTRAAVGELLQGLHPARRARLLEAAAAINTVFRAAAPAVALRGLRIGDLGRVIERQSILYADEYGWNGEYEALAARILADFREGFDPARDDAWIAELDGRMAGSIFLVRGDAPEAARLRLLYVEPEARGLGVGQRLVAACVARAAELGYGRLDLWTNSVLTAARRLYERAGFRLVAEAPHRSFGRDLVGQTWSLPLSPPPTAPR